VLLLLTSSDISLFSLFSLVSLFVPFLPFKNIVQLFSTGPPVSASRPGCSIVSVSLILFIN